jgi:hypothetical protein
MTPDTPRYVNLAQTMSREELRGAITVANVLCAGNQDPYLFRDALIREQERRQHQAALDVSRIFGGEDADAESNQGRI